MKFYVIAVLLALAAAKCDPVPAAVQDKQRAAAMFDTCHFHATGILRMEVTEGGYVAFYIETNIGKRMICPTVAQVQTLSSLNGQRVTLSGSFDPAVSRLPFETIRVNP
jgi:hypothetical protein